MLVPSQKCSRASVRMLATCSGAKRGASSMITTPPATAMYSRLAGSGVRHALAGAASMISPALRYFGLAGAPAGSAVMAGPASARQASVTRRRIIRAPANRARALFCHWQPYCHAQSATVAVAKGYLATMVQHDGPRGGEPEPDAAR